MVAVDDLQLWVLIDAIEDIQGHFRSNPADINNTVFPGGETLLMYAIRQQRHTVVKALLALESAPDLAITNEHGLTALDIAREVSNSLAIDRLQSCHADEAREQTTNQSLSFRAFLGQINSSITDFLSDWGIDQYSMGGFSSRFEALSSEKQAILRCLNTLKNTNHQLHMNAGDECTDYLLLVHGLMQIVEDDSPTLTTKQQLQALFYQRDLFIRGSRLDFCFYNGLVNQQLSLLVKSLWRAELAEATPTAGMSEELESTIPRNVYDILMPSAHSLLGTNGDLAPMVDPITSEPESVPDATRSYVRDQEGYIHKLYEAPYPSFSFGVVDTAIKGLLATVGDADSATQEAIYSREKLWRKQDARLVPGLPLAKSVIAWLTKQYPALRQLDQHVLSLEKESKSGEIRRHLTALAEGLKAGGKSGSGTEEFAGPEAALATANFADWFNDFSTIFPEKSRKLLAIEGILTVEGKLGKESKSLEQILHPILHPREALKQNKFASCSDSNGDNLSELLKQYDVIDQINKLDAVSDLDLSDKLSAEEIREIASAYADGALKRETQGLMELSSELPEAFDVNQNFLSVLTAMTASPHSTLSYGDLAKLIEVYKQKGAKDLQSQIMQPQEKSLERIAGAYHSHPALIAHQVLKQGLVLTDRELRQLPDEALKAYALALQAKDSAVTLKRDWLTRLLNSEMAKDAPDIQWVIWLIEHGLSTNTRVSYTDKRFVNLVVGTQVVLDSFLIDYQVVAREGSVLRLRAPLEVTFKEVAAVDEDGYAIYDRYHQRVYTQEIDKVSYEGDGKDDLFVDLKYQSDTLSIGKTGRLQRRTPVTPLSTTAPLMDFALDNGHKDLVVVLLNKGTDLNIDRLFSSDDKVISMPFLEDIINLLVAAPESQHISQVQFNKIFKACVAHQKENLFPKLIQLGLDPQRPEFSMTLKSKRAYGYGDRVEQVNLLRYAMQQDKRELIDLCIAKRLSIPFSDVFHNAYPSGAVTTYLKAYQQHNRRVNQFNDLPHLLDNLTDLREDFENLARTDSIEAIDLGSLQHAFSNAKTTIELISAAGSEKHFFQLKLLLSTLEELYYNVLCANDAELYERFKDNYFELLATAYGQVAFSTSDNVLLYEACENYHAAYESKKGDFLEQLLSHLNERKVVINRASLDKQYLPFDSASKYLVQQIIAHKKYALLGSLIASRAVSYQQILNEINNRSTLNCIEYVKLIVSMNDKLAMDDITVDSLSLQAIFSKVFSPDHDFEFGTWQDLFKDPTNEYYIRQLFQLFNQSKQPFIDSYAFSSYKSQMLTNLLAADARRLQLKLRVPNLVALLPALFSNALQRGEEELLLEAIKQEKITYQLVIQSLLAIEQSERHSALPHLTHFIKAVLADSKMELTLAPAVLEQLFTAYFAPSTEDVAQNLVNIFAEEISFEELVSVFTTMNKQSLNDQQLLTMQAYIEHFIRQAIDTESYDALNNLFEQLPETRNYRVGGDGRTIVEYALASASPQLISFLLDQEFEILSENLFDAQTGIKQTGIAQDVLIQYVSKKAQAGADFVDNPLVIFHALQDVLSMPVEKGKAETQLQTLFSIYNDHALVFSEQQKFEILKKAVQQSNVQLMQMSFQSLGMESLSLFQKSELLEVAIDSPEGVGFVFLLEHGFSADSETKEELLSLFSPETLFAWLTKAAKQEHSTVLTILLENGTHFSSEDEQALKDLCQPLSSGVAYLQNRAKAEETEASKVFTDLLRKQLLHQAAVVKNIDVLIELAALCPLDTQVQFGSHLKIPFAQFPHMLNSVPLLEEVVQRNSPEDLRAHVDPVFTKLTDNWPLAKHYLGYTQQTFSSWGESPKILEAHLQTAIQRQNKNVIRDIRSIEFNPWDNIKQEPAWRTMPLLDVLLKGEEQKQQFCLAFKSMYDALYDTTAVINCGPISWFRPSNHWKHEKITIEKLHRYMADKPDSRTAKTLEVLLKHVDLFLDPELKSLDAKRCALFKDLHQCSMASSRLSRTHITDALVDSIESIQDYATQHEGTRSHVLAKAVGIIG